MFDTRTISTHVYESLSQTLRQPYQDKWNEAQSDKEKKLYYDHLKEQKNQAIELYIYLSTWGLMRLKAEELSLDKTKLGESKVTDLKKRAETSQEGKREVIQQYFDCLEKLNNSENTKGISGQDGLKIIKKLEADDYLGLTGLGLELAQEFAFWANAVYHDIKGED